MEMHTNIEILYRIALFLMDEDLISPGECIKFLNLIEAGMLS